MNLTCVTTTQVSDMAQIQPKSKLQAGMTDPYINETVTYVAEMDEEAIRKGIWRPFLFFFIPSIIVGILCPIFCIIPWIMYCCVRKTVNSTVEGTHVYLTEQTLVYVEGGQPIEFSRVTIPLANIASVFVQPPNTVINIKPPAPEVILSRPSYSGGSADRANVPTYETFATRTVPIRNVKNAEAFAEATREVITT